MPVNTVEAHANVRYQRGILAANGVADHQPWCTHHHHDELTNPPTVERTRPGLVLLAFDDVVDLGVDGVSAAPPRRTPAASPGGHTTE
jgi:hypothetical protein